jgi:ABC-type branched-subunit amino acid transport system permease subunit
LAGSFYALFFKFVGVDAIGIDMTTTALLMTFIGGTKNFFGPVLGAGFYMNCNNAGSGIGKLVARPDKLVIKSIFTRK